MVQNAERDRQVEFFGELKTVTRHIADCEFELIAVTVSRPSNVALIGV